MPNPDAGSEAFDVQRSTFDVRGSAAGSAAPPVLSGRGIHKTYLSGAQRLEVLRGADLDVFAGESVAIRGESGSGKSTLLNLFSGLDAPDAGAITWGGQPPSADRRARYLGLVFQSFYLMPELDALQNVLMAARILGVPGAAEKARAKELLAKVGHVARATHVPAQLSGGERQRVAIARALMNSPQLLLADEPTGNLDERTGDAIIEMLLGLCRETKTALVLVTHNPTHAKQAQRLLTLRDGVLH